MKQNITTEQLKELNINQLNKLVISLSMDEYFHLADTKALIYNEYVLKDISEYCTIGRMIEILSKNKNFVNTDIVNEGKNEINCVVECGEYAHKEYKEDDYACKLMQGGYFELVIKKFKADELCDALWNAIKEILKEV